MDGDAARRLARSLPETEERGKPTLPIPAYVGRHGWVGIELAHVDPAELAELVEDAGRLTAPKRLVREVDR
jgi:hypothetical protein